MPLYQALHSAAAVIGIVGTSDLVSGKRHWKSQDRELGEDGRRKKAQKAPCEKPFRHAFQHPESDK